MLNQNQKNFLGGVIFLGVLVLVLLGAAYYTQNPLLSFLLNDWMTIALFGGGLIVVPGFALWKFNVLKGIFFAIIGGGILTLFGYAASGNPDARFISWALVFATFLGIIGIGLEWHNRSMQDNPRYRLFVAAVVTSLLLPTGIALASGLIWGILFFALEWGAYIGVVILFRKAGEAIHNARKGE